MVCTERTSKIAGGFVLVSVATLISVWRACQSKPLGIGDFRAYLACHEMVARRCTLEDDRPASYSFAELAKLLGVTERRARESGGRLVDAGLLEWSDTAICFPLVFTHERKNSDDLSDTIGKGRGSVAIPRRMLRFLASGARPALIATVLGILLRCLSRRRGGFDGRGRVKASWVARVFHLSIRQIKAARRELIKLGWIEPEDSDQWSWNRWGRAFRIDLGWDAPRDSKCAPRAYFKYGQKPSLKCAPDPHSKHGQIPSLDDRSTDADGRQSTPLPADPCASSTPPDLHPEPLRERETPGTRPGADWDSSRRGKETPLTLSGPNPPANLPEAFPSQPLANLPQAALPAPTLSDVRAEDLRDTARTLKLFDLAVALGLVGSSEADRLQFVALAEHARAVGTANPPGLFMHLLRSRCWRYITGEDEDRARARLREHYHPSRPPERPAARVSTFIPDKVEAGPSGLGSVLAGLMARIM